METQNGLALETPTERHQLLASGPSHVVWPLSGVRKLWLYAGFDHSCSQQSADVRHMHFHAYFSLGQRHLTYILPQSSSLAQPQSPALVSPTIIHRRHNELTSKDSLAPKKAISTLPSKLPVPVKLVSTEQPQRPVEVIVPWKRHVKVQSQQRWVSVDGDESALHSCLIPAEGAEEEAERGAEDEGQCACVEEYAAYEGAEEACYYLQSMVLSTWQVRGTGSSTYRCRCSGHECT